MHELSSLSLQSNVNLAHQQLQERIPANDVHFMMRRAITEHVQELYSIHMKDEEVIKDLQALISPTLHWICVAHQQGIYSLAKAFPLPSGYSASTFNQSVYDSTLQQICDIEESIDCPALGIKGQVDMIGRGKATLYQAPQSFYNKNQGMSAEVAQLLLPIELKTGIWRDTTSMAHRAQVILYLLLMNLRQQSFANLRSASSKLQSTPRIPNSPSSSAPKTAKYGILVYVQEKEVKIDFIWPMWDEIRSLILARNSLAKAIAEATCKPGDEYSLARLPKMLHMDSRECNYCYAASQCMMYHGASEKEVGSVHQQENGGSQYHYVMKGIHSKHLQYFKHWDRLIDLESFGQDSSRKKKSSKIILQQDGSVVIDEARDNYSDQDDCWWSRPAMLLEREGKRAISLLTVTAAGSTDGEATRGSRELRLKRATLDRSSMARFFKNDLIHVVEAVVRKEIATSSITVGDRVLISLERMILYSDSSSRSSSTAFAGLNEASRALMSVEANICSATVMQMTSDEVHLSLTLGERSMIK